MAVDQVPNRVMANGSKRGGDSRLRHGETGVDKELSVFASEDGDVPS
jgi:hypothetical protein